MGYRGPPGMPITRMPDDEMAMAAERDEIRGRQFIAAGMHRQDVMDL